MGGIIDFSIKYSLKKHAETLINAVKGVDEKASCVCQDSYATRQARFVREHVVTSYSGSQAMGTSGMLVVHVIQGHSLVAKDWNGFSDPYVRASLGLLSKRTQTVSRDCSPKWDCCLQLPVNVAHA